MRVGLFLQARLASSRFPRKVVAPFWGSTVIENCMERLSALGSSVKAIVTDEASASTLEPIATRLGWRVFIGDAVDVMKRHIDAATTYGVEVIIRATADNPLVDWKLAQWQLDTHMRSTAAATRVIGATVGTAVEVVNADALRRCWLVATPEQREHVMPVVWRWERYNRLYYRQRYNQPVTIDTLEDLIRVGAIHERLNRVASDIRKDGPPEADGGDPRPPR